MCKNYLYFNYVIYFSIFLSIVHNIHYYFDIKNHKYTSVTYLQHLIIDSKLK